MSLETLRIEDVRCLRRVDISLDHERNYFYGRNGAGKTSVLESVYLLGRGRSFRTRHMSRLVRRGTGGFTVYGEIADGERRHRLGLAHKDGRVEARLDGTEAQGLASLARLFPVYVIDPKLHQLIEAGPSERRRYIDAGVFHVEQSYLETWRAYRRLLVQRNAALKRRVSRSELAVWTGPFVEAAGIVDRARADYVDRLSMAVRGVSQRLLGEAVQVDYRSGWRQDVALEEALGESLARDMDTGFTQVGPHRGDLRIRFEKSEVRDSASRGQQKLIAAALVIGQVAEFQGETGRRATLLVDDPAAELDGASLDRLLGEVRSLGAQSLLTGLDHALLRPDSGFPVFHVEQGTVEPVL